MPGMDIVQSGLINYSIVCAGGNVGLMGQIAQTVYAGLGEESVIGVIPEALQPREVRFALAHVAPSTAGSRLIRMRCADLWRDGGGDQGGS